MAKKKATIPFTTDHLPTQEAQEFIDLIRSKQSAEKNLEVLQKIKDQVILSNPELALDLLAENSASTLPKKTAKKTTPKKKGTVQPKPLTGHKADEVKIDVPSPANLVYTKVLVDEDSVDNQGNTIEWLPKYKTEGAACVDLRVNIAPDVHGNRVVALPYRCCAKIDCGFSMQLPPDFKAEISIRSGWATKGLIVLNGPGQIDEDYRGRIAILVCNVGKEILTLKHGDRIGQMWPAPVYRFAWEKVDALDETERGTGGFGSTGSK